MPFGHLVGEVFRAKPTGRRSRIRPRREYICWPVCEQLSVPPALDELEDVTKEREVWAAQLRLVPL